MSARAAAVLASCLLAVLAYLVVVASQLDRPLMYDDANFALAAQAVADTGLPFGNQGWMSERGDFTQREQWALWHPPLYIYTLGLLARIGGWTPAVMRLLGVLGGLATAGLTYALAADLTRGPPIARQIAGAAAVAFVVLCPLVVQSTLILDIDFALLLPLSLLFLLLYLRLEDTRRRWLWLAPLFGVLLWAKLTNPLFLLPVLLIWQVLRGHPKRGGLHLVGIGLGGVALFGLSWLLVGRWLGFPLDMPFGVNIVEAQDSAIVARRAYTSPGAFIEGLQPTIVWLGPGLVGLGSIGIVVRCAQLARCWRMKRADLLIGVLAVFVLGYVNKEAGWFPKYQVALAPLLACVAAPLIAQAWCSRPRLGLGIAIASALVAGAITLGLVRDDWALQRTWAISALAGACLLGTLTLSLLVGLAGRAAAASVCAGLVGIALGWSAGIDAYQRTASYQTDYWYGTLGTQDAAGWVDAHLAPEQTYVAAKEVAIRSHDLRYVDQDNVVYFLNAGRGFNGTWAGEPVHAVVSWQREPFVADLFGQAMSKAGFHEAERFGDYVVYVPPPGS